MYLDKFINININVRNAKITYIVKRRKYKILEKNTHISTNIYIYMWNLIFKFIMF